MRYNIKIDLKEIGWEGFEWIHLAQVTNLRIPKFLKNFRKKYLSQSRVLFRLLQVHVVGSGVQLSVSISSDIVTNADALLPVRV
jgi:hypothetical protein